MNWIPSITRQINNSTLKPTKIYCFKPARQGDGASCPIMSTRDILESTKIDLFAFVESRKIKEVEEYNGLLAVCDFPPQFMKVKQSVSYIRAYEDSNPNHGKTVVASKTTYVDGIRITVNKTLREVVETHKSAGVNFYLRKRAFKYFGIILRDILSKA